MVLYFFINKSDTTVLSSGMGNFTIKNEITKVLNPTTVILHETSSLTFHPSMEDISIVYMYSCRSHSLTVVMLAQSFI